MDADIEKVKICTYCGNLKGFAEYGKNNRAKSGLLPYCRSCQAAQALAWRTVNPNKAKAMQHAYRSKDRAARYESHRRWREAHPERAAEVMRVSQRRHRARVNLATATRYATKRNATPTWLTDDHRALMRETYDTAVLATEVLGEPYEVDHIVPLINSRVCGLHVPWNLRVVRAVDNRAKGNRF